MATTALRNNQAVNSLIDLKSSRDQPNELFIPCADLVKITNQSCKPGDEFASISRSAVFVDGAVRPQHTAATARDMQNLPVSGLFAITTQPIGSVLEKTRSVAGLLERRRAFYLLRLSGLPLGSLKRIILLNRLSLY